MEKEIKICPKCGGREFFVTAHVTQEWLVDENGNYMSTIDDCQEVTHSPDDEDLWECADCGYEAAGGEFNVKDKS